MDTTRKSARKLLKIRTYLAADLPFFHNRFMGSRQKTDFYGQVDCRGKISVFWRLPWRYCQSNFHFDLGLCPFKTGLWTWPTLFFAKFVELLSNNVLSYVKDKCQDHEGISPGPRLLQKCVFCGWQIIIETPAPPPANSFWKNLKIFSFLRKIPSQELAITCRLIGQSVCQTTWILGLCPLMWAKLTLSKEILRFLLKQNTALLSHVCVLVSHRRDISSFLDNLIV